MVGSQNGFALHASRQEQILKQIEDSTSENVIIQAAQGSSEEWCNLRVLGFNEDPLFWVNVGAADFYEKKSVIYHCVCVALNSVTIQLPTAFPYGEGGFPRSGKTDGVLSRAGMGLRRNEARSATYRTSSDLASLGHLPQRGRRQIAIRSATLRVPRTRRGFMPRKPPLRWAGWV